MDDDYIEYEECYEEPNDFFSQATPERGPGPQPKDQLRLQNVFYNVVAPCYNNSINHERLTMSENLTPEELSAECSALMDEMEAELKGGKASSTDDTPDPRMTRISEIATMLSYFRPDLLDPRFGQAYPRKRGQGPRSGSSYDYKRLSIMSDPTCIIILSTTKGQLMSNPTILGYVCIYCEKLHLPEETVCVECNEYDGMIPITKTIRELLEPVDELGFCDTCDASYDVASRDGRCGDCGECRNHCEH